MKDYCLHRSCYGSATLLGVRCERTVQSIVLTLMMVATVSATSLTGSLKNPDGTGITGKLVMSLSQQAAVSSAGSCGGPAVAVPTVQKVIQVVSGALQGSPVVYGNDCLLPQGTFYDVKLSDANGNGLFTDRWVIQGSSIDIGTIVSVVVSGTTATLGGVGVVQTQPPATQTVTQPMGTVFSINNLVASGTMQFPQGTVCDTSGCNGMTFKSGVIFQGGIQTILGTNSLVSIGTGGQFINRSWTGFDANCSGVTDGFQGVRRDTHALQMCVGGLMYQVVLN